MAQGDKKAQDTKGVPKGAQMAASSQRMIVIAAFVATLVVVFLLQYVAKLDTTTTFVVGLVVLVAIVLIALFVMTTARKTRMKLDVKQTCNPMLERFKQTGDVTRFMRDYETWISYDHDPSLVAQFTQATVDALINTGHEKQARRQLKRLGEVIGTDQRSQQEYANYRKQCESRFKSMRKTRR
jgi:Na+/melibiose symporter-like transporter